MYSWGLGVIKARAPLVGSVAAALVNVHPAAARDEARVTALHDRQRKHNTCMLAVVHAGVCIRPQAHLWFWLTFAGAGQHAARLLRVVLPCSYVELVHANLKTHTCKQHDTGAQVFSG